MNTSDISKNLFDYIKDIIEFSPDEVQSVNSVLSVLKSITPTDANLILKKMNELIDLSQDIESCILTIRKSRLKILSEYKKLKDPSYVMLVKQGRPSTAAIEAEIRFMNDDMRIYEDKIEIIDDVLQYFSKIQESIKNYTWLLRDKISLFKTNAY